MSASQTNDPTVASKKFHMKLGRFVKAKPTMAVGIEVTASAAIKASAGPSDVPLLIRLLTSVIAA
jgi:hypothetical protein